MATFDDVRRLATALPEVTEVTGGHDHALQWKVKGKLFVWERPLRTSDLEHLGDGAPTGDVLAAQVADETDKHALVAEGGPYFTTPHFDGYAIVLMRLDELTLDELTEVVTDAWLSRAPAKLAKAHLGEE